MKANHENVVTACGGTFAIDVRVGCKSAHLVLPKGQLLLFRMCETVQQV